MKNSNTHIGNFRLMPAVDYFLENGLLASKKDAIITLLKTKAFMLNGSQRLNKSDVAEVLSEQELREMECVVVTTIQEPTPPPTKKEIESKKIADLLAKNGKFYANWTSTDCDGVHGMGSVEFTSEADFYKWIEKELDWVEGPFGYDIASKGQERKTWGAGWDIN